MSDRATISHSASRAWKIAVALAVLHIGLALWFASSTPYRTSGRIGRTPAPDIGAPDERAHANYIQELLDGRGFPTLDVDRMGKDASYRAEQYESHQPPLFYLAAAGWCKFVGVGDVSDPAAGMRLRALNTVFGAATVLGVFFAAWWGFKRPDLAVGAALFPALMPMSVALSGAISNDPLLIALISWTMAFLARAIRDGWTLKLAIAVGAFAGLAIITKTTGVALLPVLLVAALTPQVKRPGGLQVGVAALAIVIIAAPWLARNQSKYHDPLATNVFNRAFADNPHKEVIEQLPGGEGMGYWTNWVGWWTARSFVGVFGYMDIFLNESGTPYTEAGRAPNTLYRVCLAALALLALGWLKSLGEQWGREASSVTFVNLTLLVVVLVLFLRFNNTFFQGQARYLYPAIAPISIGFASGMVLWAKKRPYVGVGVLALSLLSLSIYAGTRLGDEFAKRAGTAEAGNGSQSSSVQ